MTKAAYPPPDAPSAAATAALRRQQVLDLIRTQHPDLWAASFEVDMTLIDYMLTLTPTERTELGQQMATTMEVLRGATKIR